MIVGEVESLWRYPVKSMRGEELERAWIGGLGLEGDRLFAFRSAARPDSFPYFTGRENPEMITYRTKIVEGGGVEVTPPSGETLAIDSPELIELLRREIDPKHVLSLMRSKRALGDCHPLSLLSIQTATQLTTETGHATDKRRFRANIYLNLASGRGFAEDAWVGKSVRIGAKATVAVVARDSRCKMIGLDPDSGEWNKAYLRQVAVAHEGMAGVYGEVQVEGSIKKGDSVELIDQTGMEKQ